MTTQYLAADLKLDEGLKLSPYPDPLTGSAPWTQGYGHTGPDVVSGVTWTLDHANAVFAADLQYAEVSLDHYIPWWRTMADPRQDVLANMAFQLGAHGVLGFHEALAAMQAGDFPEASAQMLASEWATQTPNRAKRLATQMLTGIRIDPATDRPC